jgi:hypothetical protein
VSSNRRQHWVPKAYLRGFADADERLRVFARLPDKRGVREFITTVDGIANERDLYSATSDEGRDNSLDDAIRSLVEDKLPQTLAPLTAGVGLKREEWLALVQLAGAQDMRRPSAVHNLTDSITRLLNISRDMYRHHVPGITKEEIDQRIIANWGPDVRSGEYALQPKNLAVDVLKGTIDFTGQFGGMYPCIIESQAQDFFTSDSPVFFHDPNDLMPSKFFGIDRSKNSVEVIFPLTRRYNLFMARVPLAEYVYADGTGVSLINSRVAYGAHKQVYAYPTDDAQLQRRQQRDLIRQMGVLSLAQSLFSADATTLDPTMRALFGTASRAVRLLSDSFSDRCVT